MILFDSVPCDVSCPDAVRSLLVLGVVHTCESVGMKESTLVINVNRPFMLRRPACLLAYISQTNMWPLVGQEKKLNPHCLWHFRSLSSSQAGMQGKHISD